MKVKWEVDDANSVVLNIGWFGSTLLVNGSATPVKLNLARMNHLPLALPDERAATITVTPRIATRPGFELAVEGRAVEETPARPILCDACGKRVAPGAKSCGACGHAMPPPEYYLHKMNVATATRLLGVLALLYVLIGVLLFLAQIPQTNVELAEVAGMAPGDAVPRAINGVTYTVAQYREMVIWESRSILIGSAIAAALMGLLALWARRWPVAPLAIVSVLYGLLALGTALFAGSENNYSIVYDTLICIFLWRGEQSARALGGRKGASYEQL